MASHNGHLTNPEPYNMRQGLGGQREGWGGFFPILLLWSSNKILRTISVSKCMPLSYPLFNYGGDKLLICATFVPVAVYDTSLVFWWKVVNTVPSHFTWNQKITQPSFRLSFVTGLLNSCAVFVKFLQNVKHQENEGLLTRQNKLISCHLFLSGLHTIYVVSYKEDTYGVCSLHIQLHGHKFSVCLLRWLCRRWRNVVWSGNSKAGLMPFYLSVEIAWFHSKL